MSQSHAHGGYYHVKLAPTSFQTYLWTLHNHNAALESKLGDQAQ